MEGMTHFSVSEGPRGDPMAAPSVYSYMAPLNWNSFDLVATYVILNQLFVKALFARISIVSSTTAFRSA